MVGRLVAWMVDRAGAIGRELSWQMGRPVTHSPLEVTGGFAERATWLAGAAAGALTDAAVEAERGAGAADFVRDQFIEAVANGARTLIDPVSFPGDRPGTLYLAPQVLIDVDHGMRVMTEEGFGPVVGIMPVDGDDHAMALMNDSVFGLTASIWTGDVDAALAIGDRVETSTWYLNSCDYLDPALAWTGVKHSGRGVSLSTLGSLAVTRPKSFHLRPTP